MSSGELTAARSKTASQAGAEVWHPKRRIKWGTIGRHAYLIVLCLWVLLPLAWVVLLSLKSLPEATQRYIWPKEFVDPLYTHYQFIIEKQRAVVTNFWNSVLVTSLTVVSSTITAV